MNEIIESVSLSNNDDERDPDGATNGYERAKTTAMLRRTEERLIELNRAAERLRAGTYGRCEQCGGEIRHTHTSTHSSRRRVADPVLEEPRAR